MWFAAGAVPVLVERFHASWGAEDKEIMLTSIALARIPAAVEFLLQVVTDEQPGVAAAAIRALSGYRADARLRERIQKVVDSRGMRMLAEEFARSFPN